MVPVLHIVGVPSTTQLKAKPMLHHTLGNGKYATPPFVVTPGDSHSHRFDAYTKAAEQITIAQAAIMTLPKAGPEIDRILTECITHVSADCSPSNLQAMIKIRRPALFTSHCL